MLKAAEKEKRIAIKKGSLTMKCHNRARSRKVLHMGVRNKYFSGCAVSENQGK